MTDPIIPDWLPRRLVTAREAAEILKISERQIRRLIVDGRLAAVQLGRAVRIRPDHEATHVISSRFTRLHKP